MSEYVKLIKSDNTLIYAPRTITKDNIYYNPYPVKMMINDGYKLLVKTPRPEDGKKYVLRYKEEGAQIKEFWEEVIPTERELLLKERAERENWLKDHDWIGIKIATGRAEREDYAQEIEQMKVMENRIIEIDEILSRMN